MNNTNDLETKELELPQDEVQTVSLEEETVVEQILKGIIKAYESGWNKNNEKYECRYTLTITRHKVATQDGNKNVAYLRLDRLIRPKTEVIQKEEEGWETQLIHQEVYFFKSMKEQVDPRRLWVEQLYTNCLARLLGAGLEYADLLRKMKQVKENKAQIIEPEKPKIEVVSQMPTPLTKEDEEYKQWLAAERKKEGLE